MEDGFERCPCSACNGILFNAHCKLVNESEAALFESICTDVGVLDDVCDCFYDHDAHQEYLDDVLIGSFDEPSNGYYILERNKVMNAKLMNVDLRYRLLPENYMRLPIINNDLLLHDQSSMHIIPIDNVGIGNLDHLFTTISENIDMVKQLEALLEEVDVGNVSDAGLAPE